MRLNLLSLPMAEARGTPEVLVALEWAKEAMPRREPYGVGVPGY